MKRIKFLDSGSAVSTRAPWRRQLPAANPTIGNCEFIFDAYCLDYDWLVVYDYFPRVSGERFSMWREELPCPAENTIFITVEPSSIKSYEPSFLRQFGHVLTGHEPWSIDQPGVIRSQPGLVWFYGYGGDHQKNLDDMLAEARPTKTLDLSTVCSSKKGRSTLHSKRFDFTQKLKSAIPSLDVFGHGVRPMRDKAEAIDAYRYHIAIENHRCDHHWTEKVSDVFLGWSLPIYYGCTNLREYFPEESFIEIDLDDFDGSLEIIQTAIAAREYERRLSAIAEARHRILTKYNIFAVLSDIAEGINRPEPNHPKSSTILSRHALRSSSPVNAMSYVIQSLRRRWRFRKGS